MTRAEALSRAGALAVALVCLTPSVARADGEEAAARQLFDEGRKLMDEGKFFDACPKFEEGQRLMPGIGMKFNLAECFERSGRLASAWGAFLDVASMARTQGQPDREKVARRRASALESELGKLQIVVPPAATVAGLEIKRDGVVVGRGQWSTGIFADSGKHTIEATAPARIPWSTVVTLPEGANTQTVQVPVLQIDPQASASAKAAAASQPTYDPTRGRTQRTAGLIVGGVGLLGLGVGATFGLLAINKQGQSNNHCYPGNVCDDVGVSLRNDAIGFANVSTVALAAGGALFLGGAVVYLLAPSSERAATLAIGPTGAALRGTF